MKSRQKSDAATPDDGEHASDQTPICNETPICSETIVLVGMMGVGKTTIGRRLAPKLGLKFRDADEEITRAAGMAIADLFDRHGEESFRHGEAQVIKRLLSGPPIVLATGGGAILNENTRALIRAQAVSVWIKAEIDVIVRRATRRDVRPLLQQGDPTEIVSNLLAERRQYYQQANIQIDSQPGPHARTVNAILDVLLPYLEVRKGNNDA